MVIDLKYHLLTLTAVFLALALGIVIGTSLPGAELVWGQQQSVIADLKATFTELKNEAIAREAELEFLRRQKLAAEELGRLALPLLVQGRLNGSKIGVVALSGTASPELEAVLTLAGAEIAWVWCPSSSEEYSTLANAKTGRGLALYLTGRTEAPPWPGFSGPVGAPAAIDALVLLGCPGEKASPGLASFSRALREQGITVLGADVHAAGQESSTLFFRELGISSVDNLDSPAGLAALVALLKGAQGHYGSDPAAVDGYLPPLVAAWGEGG